MQSSEKENEAAPLRFLSLWKTVSLVRYLRLGGPNWLLDVASVLSTMDLQGALQQLQAHVRTQVEIVLTNLAGVATREHFDEALYNRFLNSRQVIPLIYGQMLEWSNQLNNLAFAQGLQGLAEALNVITLEVDAALQQGVDEARKNRFIQGVTNADAVMSTFLQNVRFLRIFVSAESDNPPFSPTLASLSVIIVLS